MEAEFLGYVVMAVVTLGGFLGVVAKITQPINDLRVVVQELKDCITTLKTDNSTQNRRLDEHGKDIDELKISVGKLKTRMDIYHRE